MTSSAEREQVAELNLIAGQRAKVATAYAAALTYLTAGAALLPENARERQSELAFALELNRAECEFLTGALAESEARLADLATRAVSVPDLAVVTRLRLELFTTLGRFDGAVEVGVEYLRRVGVTWPAQPTQEDVRQEYVRMWRKLGDRPIEALLDLPRMADPVACETMDVLTALVAPTWHLDPNLRCLIIGRAVNFSLAHGNSDASCHAYALIGAVLGPEFGNYDAGFRFGRLGLDLVEHYGLSRFKARVYMVFTTRIIPWTQPIRTACRLIRGAFDAANQLGDLNYAVYSCSNLIANLLASGDHLADVQREAEAALDFVRRARSGFFVDLITPQLQLVRNLRGLTPVLGCFNDAGFDEVRFERHLEEDPRLATAACWYWVRKLQACIVANDHTDIVAAAANAERLLWTSPTLFERAEGHFYAALARAALCHAASTVERTRHLEILAAHHRQLQEWVENCSANFENCAALVGAEIARLDGRALDAMRLYELAIHSARANGFIHNEALAYELAARFYAERGFDTNSQAHLRNARNSYLKWGADGKVRHLDQLHPHLREEERAPRPTGTIGIPVEHLDLATVIKVSQAVSSEIVLDKLLDTLMHTAIEQAGAQRGLLLTPRGTEQRIAAEVTTAGDTVKVLQRDQPVTAALPESILHYVVRTREAVILDDATAENPFAADTYLHLHQSRSILCLPLINQGKLIGVLYLENNLAPHVFTPARLVVLKLLASQAAVAVENTRLYRDVVEREAKIRRLVDANIIGIFIWDSEGQIFEANDAFLCMVGQDREDLLAGRLRWTDLTPPEWRKRHERVWTPEVKMTGTIQPHEKEYFRKDGSRVPVLVGAANFDDSGKQGVSFVLDLTERKRAEAEARESERRYREVQMELAHANRVATMGQLTASIAHEVNQPIAAMVTSAQAARRWLDRQPPRLEEARQALARIVSDGKRGGDVIGRIRELIKKAPPRNDWVDINEAIREVSELTRLEEVTTGVSVQMHLAEGLPLIHGDRVQLQQVNLNLIINAVEAMGSVRDGPRELLITTGHAGSGGVLVTVRDSGPGLTPASLERLFEAFYTTKPTGLGLGLSICQSIVEAHGGRLWASANVPRGAIFHFTVSGHT
jgi:PAS domain S-box-containing protein